MKRSEPLRQKTPLARTAGLARSAPKPKRHRDTGFPASVKLAALKRAGGGNADDACCESCAFWVGRYVGDIQHRLARGMGGSSSPFVSTVVNAAVLCRPCHNLAEARDPVMHERGFWIWSWQDPAEVPVMLACGALVLFTPDGKYSIPPKEVAA